MNDIKAQSTLEILFQEKLAIKVDPIIEKKVKKIKKKDIEIECIEERELKYYDYDIIDNIKIYNGVISKDKESIINNIEFYKMISPCNIFTELTPSTLTSRGNLTNINFTEETFITALNIPPIKYTPIIKIGCNFGEIITFPNPFINHDIRYILKSIQLLNNKNIKIGCGCNKDLLNTEEVLNLINIIEKNENTFKTKFELIIEEKLISENNYKKKTIAKILKNFDQIQKYKMLAKDDIEELFIVMEKNIQNSKRLEKCNTYIDSIIKIMNIFDDYEKKCICSKKYTEEHNISLNKDDLKKKVKSSSRGRKPKDKKKNKRKIQGTGLYFSSQISFEIYNYTNKKITKIKLFRNGNFQVPGVKTPDMKDLIVPINLLKDYLNYVLSNKNPVLDKALDKTLDKTSDVIQIPYMLSVMRNYTARVNNTNSTIILNKLEDVLYYEKNMPLNTVPFQTYLSLIKKLNMSKESNYEIFKYFGMGFYTISEISFNSEKYAGLLVKFNRPIPDKKNKKLTIKILSSGKINFDGGNSELEVFEIYYWIQYIFHKYYDEIIYDPSRRLEEIISSDTESGYLSVYDSC